MQFQRQGFRNVAPISRAQTAGGLSESVTAVFDVINTVQGVNCDADGMAAGRRKRMGCSS